MSMSYTGSIIIIFIIAVRLLLKRAPKIFSYMLWAIPFFRLLFPVSFKSIWSLIPAESSRIPASVITKTSSGIGNGMFNVDPVVNDSISIKEPMLAAEPLQAWIKLGSIVWTIGILAFLIYGIWSVVRLKSKLNEANFEEKNIYRSQLVDTPFVMGLFRPKIYLPVTLSESEKDYILLHEQTHLKRFDHVIRFFSYLVVCIHWFNPLVWIAFWLSGKDMEMSCDESVIRRLGQGVKKNYSQSLLNLTIGKSNIGMTPLAFGEGDTRGRIKNIINFQRPKWWIVVIAILVLIVAFVGLMTDSKEDAKKMAERFLHS